MITLWPVWLIAGLLLLAMEIHQQAFFAVFVAAACFASAIADLAGLSLWSQGIVFAAVGLGGLAGIRRPVARHFQRQEVQLKLPGVYGGFVGQTALTLDEVGDDLHPGHAQLAGQTFLAVTDAPHPVAAQTRVVVAGVRGTTLLVRPG